MFLILSFLYRSFASFAFNPDYLKSFCQTLKTLGCVHYAVPEKDGTTINENRETISERGQTEK